MRRWRIYRAGHQPGGRYWCHPETAEEAFGFVAARRYDDVETCHRNDHTNAMESFRTDFGPFVIAVQEIP